MSIGQFLELITPTHDIRESLEFYTRLGFVEVTVGDVRSHHYAVVTDGHTAVGLHGGSFTEHALSFIHSDLADHARQLADQGTRFAFQRLSQDDFNEIGIRSPDRHLLVLMEAATFVRTQIHDAARPIPGRIKEISLRCADLAHSMEFWEQAGCITDEVPDGDTLRVYATGITLGLRKDTRWHEPVLRFEPTDSGPVIDRLQRLNTVTEPVPEGFVVTAPEGTRLLIIA
jgi:catechol 2,3-dioxygenase-like lactoylglutathione lyase family enzyme